MYGQPLGSLANNCAEELSLRSHNRGADFSTREICDVEGSIGRRRAAILIQLDQFSIRDGVGDLFAKPIIWMSNGLNARREECSHVAG
jgi:hypothetical protein